MTRTSDDARPDVTELFDDHPEDGLVCRVCGAMVPRRDDYPRVHWDWHEAANGA